MSRETAYLSHPDCLKHDMGPDHPEQPQRIRAIEDMLNIQQLMAFLHCEDAPKAKTKDLLRVHSKAHLKYLQQHAPKKGQPDFQVDPDTSMNAYTLDAALHAAGAGIRAVDLVMSGKVDNAFCAVRPPGHHAERESASGFCFFNNIAVAASYALEKYNLFRVAIVDCDVHHGNGTDNIFNGDPRVLICSSYEHPLYPYMGGPSVPGHIINTPLSRGASGAEFREAVESEWLPALNAFNPDMLFISMGLDAHWEDDMADLQFTEADYLWFTRQMVKLAAENCQGRIVSMLEGGYSCRALASSVTQHIRGLMGLD